MLELSLLFMAAGKSSRFGGGSKFLASIGPNKETLFEISFLQIIKHIHVKHIHLVLNHENNIENYKKRQKNIRYKYDLDFDITANIQDIPKFREKTMGNWRSSRIRMVIYERTFFYY